MSCAHIAANLEIWTKRRGTRRACLLPVNRQGWSRLPLCEFFRLPVLAHTPRQLPKYQNQTTDPLACNLPSNTAAMATELTVQSERAFQKQPHIFVNPKKATTSKSTRVGKGGRRWYKDVGLGFRTPKNAIEGTYIGMLCTRLAWLSSATKQKAQSEPSQTSTSAHCDGIVR